LTGLYIYRDFMQVFLSVYGKPKLPTIRQVGEGGVQSTLICIFNHCYFISSPNKLKICHTIKQLYIHNIMVKHPKMTFRKNFTINLKRVLFLSSVCHAWGALDMSMGYTWPVN